MELLKISIILAGVWLREVFEVSDDSGRMLDIVSSAGYQGYIGIEYEGQRLSEVDGINATRQLIIKASQ